MLELITKISGTIVGVIGAIAVAVIIFFIALSFKY